MAYHNAINFSDPTWAFITLLLTPWIHLEPYVSFLPILRASRALTSVLGQEYVLRISVGELPCVKKVSVYTPTMLEQESVLERTKTKCGGVTIEYHV